MSPTERKNWRRILDAGIIYLLITYLVFYFKWMKLDFSFPLSTWIGWIGRALLLVSLYCMYRLNHKYQRASKTILSDRGIGARFLILMALGIANVLFSSQ